MKSYDAVLIDSDLPHGRESGQLTVYEDRLEFYSEGRKFQVPLHLLSITAGGAGNRLLFFSHQKDHAISVYTSDRKILKEPFLVGQSHLHPQLKSSRKILRKIKFATLYTLLFFVLLIGGLYLSKDYLVRKIAEQVPVSWEQKAGDQLFTVIKGQYSLIENDSLKQVFLEVADPLLKQVRKKGVKVDLYFVNDPSINAFALPGGKVVIQSGLLDHAESWEEVMGVMSHELAHVTERHHMRGIINNLGLYGILSAFFGDMSAIAGTVASMGGDLASLSNSRAFETEADETGWDYLIAAKINPKGMISFFETLDREHKGLKMEGNLSFLSTHPDTKERIEHLRKKYRKNPVAFSLIRHDFTAFKKSFNQHK